ncbi:Uncharacterised protein [Burkholderia cepacia]|uniref:Uncharacterized protein n=2 Tax=Burkholderia cepacia TaxID=292 RepID=A0AAE8NFH2_BURCE|nr:hypothetical protein CSX04_01288 [Burkholderia cepacia]SPV20234.1 Uncharacterised protein [Burkholderia cepacia]
MIEEADDEHVTLDVRDQSYLVTQLSKNTTIFARYFSDVGVQLGELLGTPDPLRAASDRLQHALLATLGAYVLHEHSRLARGTLFDKTVLAALAGAKEGKVTREQLLQNVRFLLPSENVNRQQVDSAVERLKKSGECLVEGESVACSEAVLLNCLAAATRAENGFEQLRTHLQAECRKVEPLTDAGLGYLERNLRRAVVHLLRVSGPLKSDDEQGLHFDPSAVDEIRTVLGQDLSPAIARAAVVAFSSFVSDPMLSPSLAPLVNSYAALAMRNLDPIGRRWQQLALSRSVIAIDTDALLSIIVEELPEHIAILHALKSLQAEGVEIVIPEHVFTEAVGHLARAPRTYRRFADRLLRFPAELVDAQVWHAVVRGYYYAKKDRFAGTFESYFSKYHHSQNPAQFTEHLVSKRLASLKRKEMDDVQEQDEEALAEIGLSILTYRERVRRKATFRDPAEMAQRVREDVAMALTLAARADDTIGSPAKGYVASADRAFQMIESHDNWHPRKQVHLWTNALPQLSFFACGDTLAPNEAVEFVFSPVTIAAANLMADQLNMLATIGVDLKDASLDRLDWDLRQGLAEQLNALSTAVVEATTDDDEASAIATLRVAQTVSQAGYVVAPQVETLVQEFDSTKERLAAERQKRQQAEDQLRKLVSAMREQSTNKGRRRLNKLVDEVGIVFEEDDDNDDVEESGLI